MIDILTVEWSPNPFGNILRDRVDKHTKVKYRHHITQGGNTGSYTHGRNLDKLFAQSNYPYVVTLDADAFPIQDGWGKFVIQKLEDYTAVAIEHPIRGYCHPSFFAAKRSTIKGLSFQRKGSNDAGEALSYNIEDPIFFLPVTSYEMKNPVNRREPALGSVYYNMIFHHWYTSRALKKQGTVDGMDNQIIRDSVRRCVQKWTLR